MPLMYFSRCSTVVAFLILLSSGKALGMQPGNDNLAHSSTVIMPDEQVREQPGPAQFVGLNLSQQPALYKSH